MQIRDLSLHFTLCFILFYASPKIYSDSFEYNSYNNHGVLGLINTPTARFYKEGAFGITAYDGTPDQKITITSSPYDWLEASFFYTNYQGRPSGFDGEDFKDKGFNFKARLKEEGVFPAIAIGVNDIAGTGFYSSEYIIGSYGISNLDIHFGLAWGKLNGADNSFKNPLIYISDKFRNRPSNENDFAGKGGQFQPSRYFSDETVSPLYGVSYAFSNKFLLKIEHDTTQTPGNIGFEVASSRASYAIEYSPNKNFTLGLSQERDNYLSLKFIYKQNVSSAKKPYKYQKVKKDPKLNKYGQLIKNLESNGIGVNKIRETSNSVGIEITQFIHPNLDLVEEILMTASRDSGITKDIKTDYRIANLQAYSNINEDFEENSTLIYKRKDGKKFNTSNKFSIRPFIAAREGFLKAAFLLENDSEYIFSDNFFFSSNLKYSIWDNFDELTVPPIDTYPAQVRSDVKDYMQNFDKVIIGRAQFDYHLTLKKNNHIMLTAGILEEMFNGLGLEYLYFDNSKNYAVGFEIFEVKKRDYNLRFGTLDYRNTTGSINFYYRNYQLIPFDAKISYGEYLAGDVGTTFELSRSFLNGAQFGVFASFTDVTSEQFGEGTFDKGLFFTIPVYKNLVNYTWRPLTKDPGAKLNRKHRLHDLLVRFKPYRK